MTKYIPPAVTRSMMMTVRTTRMQFNNLIPLSVVVSISCSLVRVIDAVVEALVACDWARSSFDSSALGVSSSSWIESSFSILLCDTYEAAPYSCSVNKTPLALSTRLLTPLPGPDNMPDRICAFPSARSPSDNPDIYSELSLISVRNGSPIYSSREVLCFSLYSFRLFDNRGSKSTSRSSPSGRSYFFKALM